MAAAGRVYLASGEGVVTVIAAGKEQLEVLARKELGEDIVATPAIVGSAIYVGRCGICMRSETTRSAFSN